MKVGLVLEGGAMRGMYTCGIMDTMLENNIEVDAIVGVSAGALFGVNYVSKQIGRGIRYTKKFAADKRYMSARNFIKDGNFIGTEFAYITVPQTLDVFDYEAYRQSPVKFYAVVTNIETGKAEYKLLEDVDSQIHTLRASGSMPFLSTPVELDGQKYLDGGIADSIPFQWMAQQGYDKIIVILTRSADYRKKSMVKPLVKAFYGRKYPNLVKSLNERHNVYNRSTELLTHWEEAGRAFVIRPTEPVDIGRTETDPDKLQAVYELGLADGKKYIDDLKKYLSE
ncbi:MAG: patatin family protein [Eubacterium sp.]|nr:patatin family protein [Candidatus Colimonas fimequi]